MRYHNSKMCKSACVCVDFEDKACKYLHVWFEEVVMAHVMWSCENNYHNNTWSLPPQVAAKAKCEH